MLKLLACLLMLLDHIGFYFGDLLPGDLTLLLRTLGRLAFPIFAWSVARGFARTHNILVYFLRMSGFAVVAEVIIRFAHSRIGYSSEGTNVLVTFALAIVLLAGYQMARYSWRDVIASLRPVTAAPNTVPTAPHFHVRINLGGIELDPRIGLPLGVFMIILALTAALYFKPDYMIYGLLSVLGFHIAMDKKDESLWRKRSIQYFTLVNIAFLVFRIITQEVQLYWAILQCFSIFAVPICFNLAKDKKPSVLVKYGFYLFYPVHILILCLIRAMI